MKIKEKSFGSKLLRFNLKKKKWMKLTLGCACPHIKYFMAEFLSSGNQSYKSGLTMFNYLHNYSLNCVPQTSQKQMNSRKMQ